MIEIVPHSSPGYWAAVELRRRILRYPLGLDFTEDELAKEDREFHFVAERDGEVVGCLVMAPQNCSVVKMRQVAVEPGLQGHGIGAELACASERWARDEGYSQIELHARDTAVSFYLRLGYQVVGEPFEEVTVTHRRMVKDLRVGS